MNPILREKASRKLLAQGWEMAMHQINFLVLGGHFDHAWLVNDASGAISLLNYSYDPRLITFLLLNVLAIGSSLFTRQAYQKSSRSLGRVSLQQLEHVSTGFSHGFHLSNHWQVVDNERDLKEIILMRILLKIQCKNYFTSFF